MAHDVAGVTVNDGNIRARYLDAGLWNRRSLRSVCSEKRALIRLGNDTLKLKLRRRFHEQE